MESTKVLLPKSIEELRTKYFPDLSKFDIVKISCGFDQSDFTQSQKAVLKYSGAALAAGRPLDTVMIFMAGVTGSGKSSTINALFEDKDLCKTSSGRSETEHVAVIRKLLSISDENTSIQGYLSFVDVPGTFDTDLSREAQNMAIIRKFRNSQPELANRTGTQLKFTSVRNSVYPNIVLFVINAGDERMDGKDSELARSLIAFKETANLLDNQRNNIIVVLTHAMSIGTNKKRFKTKLAETTKIIKQQFQRLLDVVDVEVVPVENKPEAFRDSDSEQEDDSQSRKTGEFFKLPDGSLSHLNLFQAMCRCFNANNDIIGHLLVSSYFHTDCPEKVVKAEMTIYDGQTTETEVGVAAEDLSSLQIVAMPDARRLTLLPHFQSIMKGYCPITESLKADIPVLVNPSSMETIQLGNSEFAVSKHVLVFRNRASGFQRLTYWEKEKYQNEMQNKYGLDAGFKLIVKTGSEGKWVNTENESKDTFMISVTHEIQVAQFKIENPANLELNPKFREDIDKLPDEYIEKTKTQFLDFFSRWGTHLIQEQSVGGSVQLNCTLNKASRTSEQLDKVQFEVDGLFTKLFSSESGYKYEDERKKLRGVGITNEHLRIIGGDPPRLINFEHINPQMLHKWAETVNDNPAQLNSSIKLYPYYNYLTGNKFSALREATKEYLSDNLSLGSVSTQAMSRNEASEAAIKKIQNGDSGSKCFPKGAEVRLITGTNAKIEDLNSYNATLTTYEISKRVGCKNKFQIGKQSGTKFCTYLDFVSDHYCNYMVLEFDNGKSLAVTKDHLIFQYFKGCVVPKRAKYFKIGDKTVYVETGTRHFETAALTRISKQQLLGAYCPLTSSGTLVVDGFFVSSYSDTDSFTTAQAVMIPLKLWCQMSMSFKKLKCVENCKGINPYAKFLLTLRNNLTSVQ